MQNLRKEARFPYAGTKNLLLFFWSALVYLSMKYRVNGIEIPLDRKETTAAKRMVAKFMEEVDKNSKDTGNTSLYFTTLILMQVLSQEALDHIDSETLVLKFYTCIWIISMCTRTTARASDYLSISIIKDDMISVIT